MADIASVEDRAGVTCPGGGHMCITVTDSTTCFTYERPSALHIEVIKRTDDTSGYAVTARLARYGGHGRLGEPKRSTGISGRSGLLISRYKAAVKETKRYYQCNRNAPAGPGRTTSLYILAFLTFFNCFGHAIFLSAGLSSR